MRIPTGAFVLVLIAAPIGGAGATDTQASPHALLRAETAAAQPDPA